MNDRQWTGAVLVGGKSTRMGRDKALIERDGQSMMQHAIELLRPHAREVLVIGDPEKYRPQHAQVVPDNTPGKGPLGGVVTALRHARYVRVLVLACDLPNINDRLLIRLKSALIGEVDAVVPRHPAGIEPLAAAYHRHAIDAFLENLAQERLRMSDALTRVKTVHIDLRPGEDGWPNGLFANVNAPSDL